MDRRVFTLQLFDRQDPAQEAPASPVWRCSGCLMAWGVYGPTTAQARPQGDGCPLCKNVWWIGIDMRRTFTIQLYDAANRHKHTCEQCSGQWHCGETECPRTKTLVICDACYGRFDCPQCGTDVIRTVVWASDSRTDQGLITHYNAKCPNCNTGIVYRDNDDSYRPLRIMWKPSDITAVQHIVGITYKGVDFPPGAITKVKGTFEPIVHNDEDDQS